MVLTSSRYAGLSPKQLVPQLADEGLYLASESTMYRMQRRHGLRTSARDTRKGQAPEKQREEGETDRALRGHWCLTNQANRLRADGA